VTRNSANRIRVWVGELSWSSQAGIGGDGQRDLVSLQVFLSERTSWGRELGGLSPRVGFIEPIAHVAFHREEVRDFVRVGGTRSGLQHEPTILRVEQRHNNAVYR